MPNDDTPAIVRLQSSVDNLKGPEDLPLAPWYESTAVKNPVISVSETNKKL
jgi:hypothetical protein